MGQWEGLSTMGSGRLPDRPTADAVWPWRGCRPLWTLALSSVPGAGGRWWSEGHPQLRHARVEPGLNFLSTRWGGRCQS